MCSIAYEPCNEQSFRIGPTQMPYRPIMGGGGGGGGAYYSDPYQTQMNVLTPNGIYSTNGFMNTNPLIASNGMIGPNGMVIGPNGLPQMIAGPNGMLNMINPNALAGRIDRLLLLLLSNDYQNNVDANFCRSNAWRYWREFSRRWRWRCSEWTATCSTYARRSIFESKQCNDHERRIE